MRRQVMLALALTAMTLGVGAAEAKYGFVFFRGNGERGVYLATSADGLNWTEQNGGKSVLPATLDDKITRDPSVCVGPDGKYHIVFTTSWHHRGFGVAHSDDLYHWTTPEFVPINEDWKEAKNTWAPEIVWDADAKQYFVVWATAHRDPGDHRQYYTTTKDFKTWAPRKLYYDPGHSVIDAFPFRFKGQWVMIAKNETHKPVAHDLHFVRSKAGAYGPWEKEGAPFTDKTKFWAEGATALELENGLWVVYFDCYNKGHYGARLTRDFKTFTETPFTLPKGIRHGTAFRLKK